MQKKYNFICKKLEETGPWVILVLNNISFFLPLKEAADYSKAVLLNSGAQSPFSDTLDCLTLFLHGQ